MKTKHFTIVVLLAAAAFRLAYAAGFQGKIWIDEVWVVLNPAYHLLTGQGYLNPLDWNQAIRSWFPPLLCFLPLKFFQVLGLGAGPVSHLGLRLIIGGATFWAGVRFSVDLAKRFKLKQQPVVAWAFVLLTPELIRHSVSADLSVLALPFLLWGLVLRDKRPWGSSALLTVAVLIRSQYVMIPAAIFLCALVRKNWATTGRLITAAILGFLFDFALNSYMYGRPVSPLINYVYLNTVVDYSATFGVTPFYFAFELLWRFMTEPVFVACVFSFLIWWKKDKELTLGLLGLIALHMAAGHKEFRFFYGPAFIGAAMAGIWIQSRRKEIVIFATVIFLAVAAYRADKKIAWSQYEIPARLATTAGLDPNVRGLLVYGWGGIYDGGQYSFFRNLPYEYAETIEGLRGKGLDPSHFSHVITTANVKPPCSTVIEALMGAALYRCTAAEMIQHLKGRL